MENFPNLMREKGNPGITEITQIQESQRVPKKRNPKSPISKHIKIKMAKFQDKENLQGSKGETGSNIQGSPDKVSS